MKGNGPVGNSSTQSKFCVHISLKIGKMEMRGRTSSVQNDLLTKKLNTNHIFDSRIVTQREEREKERGGGGGGGR